MAYELPVNFAQDANEIARLLDECEAAISFAEKSAQVRQALVIGCRLLSSLKLDNLRREIDMYYAKGLTDVSKVIDNSTGHFDYFLENVERSILANVCFNTKTQARALAALRQAQQIAQSRILTSAQVIAVIQNLRSEVCGLKQATLKEELVIQQMTLAGQVLAATIIVADVVAPIVFPPASPAAITASVTLGGVAAGGITALSKL